MVPRVEPPPRPQPAPRLFSRISQISKKSFRSHSSSFEADDERSSNDDSMSETSLDEDGRAAPRYLGDDTRPTSTKEIAGWYAYAFAAEVYVICGIGSFIPILLETLARENGVLLSDRTTPCGSSSDKNAGDGQCIVYVLGMEINTASFAMYTFSVSVFLQALIVVSISCAADHGNLRKKMLLAFAWIGSASVMLYIFINKDIYVLGALLAIVSNTAFGASFVLLNSFLPLLVRNHPLVEYADKTRARHRDASIDDGESEHMVDSTVALLADDVLTGRPQLQRIPTHEDVTSLELTLSTQISAKGIGTGYLAGLFLQIVAILILVAMKNSEWSLRIVLFLIGAWWAVFTIPAALWLRPRPGPPLPASSAKSKALAWIHYTIYAWKSLFRTIRLARRLVDIVLFLAGWFLLSDAIATTSSTAILFAKTQLHMKPWALGMINVISTAAGVTGALTWAFISKKLNLKPHQTILACIALFELIPIYGLLGYLPFVKRWGVIGLQQKWEMYPLAAVYGFVLGGLSGYCRSLYGELIPPGSEAAFYALYAITDKGSSVFGPAIVGAIIDASGEIRPAFWFLGALVGLPAVFIWFVNADRGKREGEKLAEEIEGWKRAREEEQAGSESEGAGILGAAYGEDQDDG